MIIVSADYDYLRPQNEAVAAKLRALGVDVRAIRYLGCDHGFFETCGVMPQVEDLCLTVADELSALAND